MAVDQLQRAEIVSAAPQPPSPPNAFDKRVERAVLYVVYATCAAAIGSFIFGVSAEAYRALSRPHGAQVKSLDALPPKPAEEGGE